MPVTFSRLSSLGRLRVGMFVCRGDNIPDLLLCQLMGLLNTIVTGQSVRKYADYKSVSSSSFVVVVCFNLTKESVDLPARITHNGLPQKKKVERISAE